MKVTRYRMGDGMEEHAEGEWVTYEDLVYLDNAYKEIDKDNTSLRQKLNEAEEKIEKQEYKLASRAGFIDSLDMNMRVKDKEIEKFRSAIEAHRAEKLRFYGAINSDDDKRLYEVLG